LDQLGQVRLEQRRLTSGELTNSLLIDVDPDHLVTEPSHAGRMYGTEITATEYSDPHLARLGKASVARPPESRGNRTGACLVLKHRAPRLERTRPSGEKRLAAI
jgi:hypothetical protein